MEQVPTSTLVKRRIKSAWRTSRWPTRTWRALPAFVVIGAPKAGTTSVFRYLCAHPSVARPLTKETNHFSDQRHWGLGLDEYRTHFPLRMQLERRGAITGEASGQYLYAVGAAERVVAAMPGVRLIVVLREPVERTVSNYFHARKYGWEQRPFEVAIDEELASYENDDRPPNPRFDPRGDHNCYVGRSLYAHHLQRWYEVIDPASLLIVESEQLYADPPAEMDRVAQFLGLDPFPPITYPQHNPGKRTEVETEARERLTAYFRTPNTRLDDLMQRYCPDQPRITWAHPSGAAN